MNKTSIIITILVAVIVGAGGFFSGMKYAQSKSPSAANDQFAVRFGQGGANGRFGAGRGAGFMPTIGKVVSSDSNSITVQMQDGSSKIINISTNTKIMKTNTASMSDLTNGTQVAVIGTSNSDGSVDAQSVQINPSNFIRFGRNGTPAPTQGQQ